MDECEILDYNYDFTKEEDEQENSLAAGKSSHKHVSLCSDNETPRTLRDGEFSKFSYSLMRLTFPL